MATVNCTQCGKVIERRRYHVNLTERPFCGFECYGAWQSEHRKGQGRKRVVVSCATCGKAIERPPSAVNERNFCDRQCWAAWRATDAWAGENNPAWRGGHSQYRGPNWDSQRSKARERDGYTCQGCGVTQEALGKELDVHHKRPFRLFDDYREANHLDNLVSLCSACHSGAEMRFWREHPEIGPAPFPAVIPVATCRKCGADYTPRSASATTCDACCTATCQTCDTPFYSRRATHRTVKYCSRECRHAAVRSAAKVCPGCGGSKHRGAERCRACAHSSPRS